MRDLQHNIFQLRKIVYWKGAQLWTEIKSLVIFFMFIINVVVGDEDAATSEIFHQLNEILTESSSRLLVVLVALENGKLAEVLRTFFHGMPPNNRQFENFQLPKSDRTSYSQYGWVNEISWLACRESSNEVKRAREENLEPFFALLLWIYSLIMSKYLLWQKSFADRLNLRHALILKHETLWRMLMKLENIFLGSLVEEVGNSNTNENLIRYRWWRRRDK